MDVLCFYLVISFESSLLWEMCSYYFHVMFVTYLSGLERKYLGTIYVIINISIICPWDRVLWTYKLRPPWWEPRAIKGVLFLKPGVGTYPFITRFVARASSLLIFAFPVHFTLFPPKPLQTKTAKCLEL